MAQVISPGKVRKNDGSVINAVHGEWYDGQHYLNGSLSNPNQIHKDAGVPGAGQQVSAEVRAQSAAAQGVTPQKFDSYLASQGAKNMPTYNNNAILAERGIGTGAGMSGGGNAGVPNLMDVYKNATNTPEIQKLKENISKVESERDAAISDVQNNPWFSQSTRGGKIASIESDADKDLTRYIGQLNRYMADAETQLNITTKQYDLESQARQQALSEFNTLLSSGALEGASDQDIATISSYTGISSNMIASAIQTSKMKGTSLQTYDDGYNQYVIALDSMGNVVNKQVIGASKPKGPSANTVKEYEMQINMDNAATDASKGATLEQLVNRYAVSGGLSVDDVYRIYSGNTNRGAPKETLDQVKKGIFANRSGFVSEYAQ